jgi:LEA14-like dessication related protein
MRALVFALLTLVACSKPAPPTLVPKSAVVNNISTTGIGIDVLLTATNPNSVDLTASDVRAHLVLDKTIEVGDATVEEHVRLPANQDTDLKVALSIPWANVGPLFELGMSDRRSIPYRLDGSLTLGGDLMSVQVPFRLAGNVSREQILQATLSSIPPIPALSGLIPPSPPGAETPTDPAAPVPTAPIPGRRAPGHPRR